jgi:Ca-activated chloride channel family protein
MSERIVPRTGLFTTQALAVPLSGVSIEAVISSFCARVAVTQRYVNREPHPIEAVYVFPLDEGAAVCGFEAVIDGTLVVGEVKEREEAFRMYDDAMERGDGAFLLDEERPDVFQASIGNLAPGKEVLVKLTYVTELDVAGESLRFVIPTTVSPRYAPAEDHRGVGRPDADTLNPPVEWHVPYGLDLVVRLMMGGTISQIASPSHPVSVAIDSNSATVTLSQRDIPLDRDFVLTVDSAGLDTPQAWIERDEDGTHVVAVAFVPRLDAAVAPCEVIFLVDRSGSMGGTSIEEVRNALQLCLHSMVPGCTFNIIGFGSTVQALFQESRAYDEASLAEASTHVRLLQADLGGTEILPALELVLGQPRCQGLARQIVVLTDGEVTNTDAVLGLASRHVAHARIFTFGIGAGSSRHLVKGLARAGGGTAEFIYPGERLEAKVVRQFGRLLSPALTDVRLDWGGLDVTRAPSTMPPVFTGGRFLSYAFVRELASTGTPTTVQLAGMSRSGPIRFDVELDPARAVGGRTVATLAARARIRELEESPEWTTARGSRQQERKAGSATKEIVALSMRYGLMSRDTSYVAVERREIPVLGDVKLRRVPIALTTGWGGGLATGTFLVPRLTQKLTSIAPVGAASRAPDELDEQRRPMPSDRKASSRAFSRQGLASQARSHLSRLRAKSRASFGRGDEQPAPPALSVSARMHALVALQRADGSWDLTPDFAAAIGHDLAPLESPLRGVIGNADEARKAWATALALAWLDTHAHDVEDQWRLLAAKGRGWLRGVSARLADGTGWAEAGTTFLSTMVVSS